jgi:serine/threonine protein kinase
VSELYGAGPLGFAFRAKDQANRDVAVKVLHPSIVPTETERTRTLIEIEKIASRTMRTIALPTDAGFTGKFAYVVSPWINGRSLRRVLGAFRDAAIELSPGHVHGILHGTVEALRELHGYFVHGAVYPENIQITVDGMIRLTDVGIAGAISRSRWLEHLEYFPDVMPYVSAEFRQGKPLTASSDLWAVGALASELLTGDAASLAEGISRSMLGSWSPQVAQALEKLTSMKTSVRVAALPALLDAIAAVAPERFLPQTGNLPAQRARTELIHRNITAVNEGTSPGIALVSRRNKKKSP